MLSKVRSFRKHSETHVNELRSEVKPNFFLKSIGYENAVVQRIESGTLSAAFIAKLPNIELFLKTHIFPEGEQTLQLEYHFLSKLYSNEIFIQTYREIVATTTTCDAAHSKNNKLWLTMSTLSTNNITIEPSELHSLIRRLDLNSISIPQYSLNRDTDTFFTILLMAIEASVTLNNLGLLDSSARRIVDCSLSLLEQSAANLIPSVCHGDLSPANIMRFSGEPIIIDWEDTFIGVRDYDYLYWLTFFNNRRFYADNPLRYVDMGVELSRAIVVMIVVLKCELAWRSNSWQNHSLSFSERIVEVSKLN